MHFILTHKYKYPTKYNTSTFEDHFNHPNISKFNILLQHTHWFVAKTQESFGRIGVGCTQLPWQSTKGVKELGVGRSTKFFFAPLIQPLEEIGVFTGFVLELKGGGGTANFLF